MEPFSQGHHNPVRTDIFSTETMTMAVEHETHIKSKYVWEHQKLHLRWMSASEEYQ